MNQEYLIEAQRVLLMGATVAIWMVKIKFVLIDIASIMALGFLFYSFISQVKYLNKCKWHKWFRHLIYLN